MEWYQALALLHRRSIMALMALGHAGRPCAFLAANIRGGLGVHGR